MEKRRPHYRLSIIQKIVADPAARVFTASALDGALEMGLTEAEMRSVVCGMSSLQFYKSMTTHRDHAVWQDVYHAMTPVGIVAYIKITGGRPSAGDPVQAQG